MLYVVTMMPNIQLDEKCLKYLWTKPTIKFSNTSVNVVHVKLLQNEAHNPRPLFMGG